MILEDEKGLRWFVDNVKTETADNPVIDSESGPKRIITSYVIQAMPGQKKEDILAFHRKSIEDNLFRRGITLTRELDIYDNGNGEFNVIAVSKPRIGTGGVEQQIFENPHKAEDVLKKESKAKKGLRKR